MNDYILYTDSACDIPPAKLKELGVAYSSLTTYFEEEDRSYTIEEMDATGFYQRLRGGQYPKTAAVNIDTFTCGFEKILKQGLDILYVGLSGKVSSTYNSAKMAAEALSLEYPQRKIITVDCCSGSIGQAMLLSLILEQKSKGATLEEAAAFAEKTKSEICLWATFDDLTALQKSGRVSMPTALLGNLLNIKPIIHVNEEGSIINHSKVRGRKKSIGALIEKFGEFAKDKLHGKLYLAHGDCLQEAQELVNALKEKFGAVVQYITDVGPVIGSHAGLGSLVLSFIGRKVKA